ncbi:transposase, MuDR, MULE transposase domain protein [Tanacetum coccineum]
MSSSHHKKFKVHLVCLQSTRVVLLPKEINYGQLINYCKQKFSINNTCMINLTYKLCSDTIDLCDDDIEVFINDILSSNDLVSKIFITLSQVIASSKSKSTDFDLNIPLYDPNNLTYSSFKYMPSPPRAPPVVIRETKSHAHNIALPINVGDKFDNKVVCMFVIAKKAVIEGYEFFVLKSCTKRYSVRCAQPECKWRIYNCRLKNSKSFLTTSIHNIHTCSITQLYPNHRNALKMLVGHMIVENLRNNKRVYSGKDIQNDFRLDWKIDISYKRAWSGKNVALEILNGSQENSFVQLPLYCHYLKMANNGTVTHIQTNDDGTFDKCFISFGVSIRSFLYYMRPLIKIDGAHLKGTYLGTNLLAVGMDANNQIIPLATGVAQGETVENWSWFLTKLKECIGDVPNLAIISDRHYSITIPCRTVFPQAFMAFVAVICC